jgi:N-methylhydantoinase B/oxoprolinase/acetone carboxylase alpha subunit
MSVAKQRNMEEVTQHRVADPILLSVIGGRLSSIATEMASTLQRTAYSMLCRESEDLGCGIYDSEGRELAESQTTPLMHGALSGMIQGFLERLEGKLSEGDVILHNHPYKGAVHAPDVCVAVPIFSEGALSGFAASSTHLLDLGGAFPGINVDVVDMWGEAQIYDSVLLYQRGVRNEALWQLILDNTRTPTLNRGDLEALIASCFVGRDRYLQLLAKYGLSTVMNAVEDWMDYSEFMLRREIARVPDGEYVAPTAWLDDDGRNRDEHLKVCVKVVIEGSDLTIDLTGSNPEVETAFNSPFLGATYSTAKFITRTVFLDEARTDETIPQNDGLYRPIKVIAPKGTIFNPNFPRATMARFCPVQRIADSFILALASAIPDKTSAGSAAHTYFASYAGWDEGAREYWAYLEGNEGSYGARFGSDGLDAVDTLIANTRNTPVEELELRYPIRVDRYELRECAPAPGRWRGGISAVRQNRFLTDVIVSCEGDRSFDPPKGVHGGRDGSPGCITHVKTDGSEAALYSKFSGHRITAGEALRFEGPMGGGFGDPTEREPEDVLRDVLDGYISPEEARAEYGVVLTRDGKSIDQRATTRARQDSRAKREGA